MSESHRNHSHLVVACWVPVACGRIELSMAPAWLLTPHAHPRSLLYSSSATAANATCVLWCANKPLTTRPRYTHPYRMLKSRFGVPPRPHTVAGEKTAARGMSRWAYADETTRPYCSCHLSIAIYLTREAMTWLSKRGRIESALT